MARESSTLESATKQKHMQLLFPQVVKVLVPNVSLLTLDALRLTSQDARAAAQLEGKRRVRRGRFFVQPLVEGWTEKTQGDGFDGDSETEEVLSGSVEYATRYEKLDLIALDDTLRAPAGSAGEFAWSHGPHRVLDYDDSERAVMCDNQTYAGWKLRVYWQPADADQVQVPIKRNFRGGYFRRPGLLLFETSSYPIGKHAVTGWKNIGTDINCFADFKTDDVRLELEVIDSTEEVIVEPLEGHYSDSDEDYNNDEPAFRLDRNKVTHRYSYGVRLDRLHVDPAVLVFLAKRAQVTAAYYAELEAEERARLDEEEKRLNAIPWHLQVVQVDDSYDSEDEEAIWGPGDY